MTKFETGKTYQTRSPCDYDCIIQATILRRTAKTVSATIRGETKTFRLAEYRGTEYFSPWGRYSMAPIMDAEDVVEP